MPATPKNACSNFCKKDQRPFQRKGKIPIVIEEYYITTYLEFEKQLEKNEVKFKLGVLLELEFKGPTEKSESEKVGFYFNYRYLMPRVLHFYSPSIQIDR